MATATATSPKKAKTQVAKASSNGREPRKETYDKKRLTAVASNLKDLLDRTNVLAKEIEGASVQVDGHAMLIRALSLIDNMLCNTGKAINQSKRAAANKI